MTEICWHNSLDFKKSQIVNYRKSSGSSLPRLSCYYKAERLYVCTYCKKSQIFIVDRKIKTNKQTEKELFSHLIDYLLLDYSCVVWKVVCVTLKTSSGPILAPGPLFWPPPVHIYDNFNLKKNCINHLIRAVVNTLPLRTVDVSASGPDACLRS